MPAPPHPPADDRSTAGPVPPPTLGPVSPTADGPPTLVWGTTSSPAEGTPPAAGRFRILRSHARGGLGEVFVACDEELNRDVALKRIQPRYADEPTCRRRFLTETELTARLEHPGIGPVHGLVRDASGQPCYAMRFIQGATLSEAINRLHALPSSDPGRGLALRQLLQRFVQVCNTIAYAHSRGVIHRDLKPQNVMLGPF